MVLSGLPPLVREGDRFKAEFTIRNTTKQTTEVDVSPKVTGLSEPLRPLPLLCPWRGERDRMGCDCTDSI